MTWKATPGHLKQDILLCVYKITCSFHISSLECVTPPLSETLVAAPPPGGAGAVCTDHSAQRYLVSQCMPHPQSDSVLRPPSLPSSGKQVPLGHIELESVEDDGRVNRKKPG